MKKRIPLLVLTVAAIAIGLFLLTFHKQGACKSPSLSADDDVVVARESRDLLGAMRTAYWAGKQNALLIQAGTLPEPTGVHISGADVTIYLASSIDKGDLTYAQIWQKIYTEYHGFCKTAAPCYCVSVTFSTPSGDVRQDLSLR